MRGRPRLRLPGAAAAALLALAAASAAQAAVPPPPKISGSDATVWNVAAPTPTYTITGSARGVSLKWTLTGTTQKGSGRSPLTVRLPGLASGTYTLEAAQSPDGKTAKRKVRVDVTPPAVAIRQPVNGAVYPPGQVVAVDYSCSGATSCSGTLPDGAALPTSAAGPETFTVTAADSAGNTAAQTVSYAVGPVAPTITGRPAGPVRGTRPAFSWSGGEPGAVFTWQVLAEGAVISQGDTISPTVSLGPLPPGSYAFQVRQRGATGVGGPYSVADPFTVVQAVAASAVLPAPVVRAASPLRPGAGAAPPRARPLLAWRRVPRAALYNVQVFHVRGTSLRKVASVFPRGTRTRVAGLRFGRRYAWRVWPWVRRAGYTREPLGLSYFDLTRPVRVGPAQMLVDRRVAQAALRRVNAIEQWLDAGVTAGDLRHEGLGASAFAASLGPRGPADAAGTAAAATRPIGTGAGARARGPIRATPRELLRTRRIAQSAVRRLEGVEERLAGGLTGGDVVDGSIGPEQRAGGVSLASPRGQAQAAPRTVTVVAPARHAPRRVRVTRRALLISQKTSQGALRRAGALRARLLLGLSTADFQPGSIGPADLAPALLGRR